MINYNDRHEPIILLLFIRPCISIYTFIHFAIIIETSVLNCWRHIFTDIIRVISFFFSIGERNLPFLSNHSSKIEKSLSSQQYTDTHNLSERIRRPLVTQIDRCDSDLIASKQVVTSYSDVAKKLVRVSKSIDDGANVKTTTVSAVNNADKDNNDEILQCEDDLIGTGNSNHNNNQDYACSIGDKNENDKDDDAPSHTSNRGKPTNDSDSTTPGTPLGTALIAFPYMQVRFFKILVIRFRKAKFLFRSTFN